MTKEEAINKVLKIRPGAKVLSVDELKKCFVVSVIPKNFDENSDDLYIGGAVRVDKKTGNLSQFNPLIEESR